MGAQSQDARSAVGFTVRLPLLERPVAEMKNRPLPPGSVADMRPAEVRRRPVAPGLVTDRRVTVGGATASSSSRSRSPPPLRGVNTSWMPRVQVPAPARPQLRGSGPRTGRWNPQDAMRDAQDRWEASKVRRAEMPIGARGRSPRETNKSSFDAAFDQAVAANNAAAAAADLSAAASLSAMTDKSGGVRVERMQAFLSLAKSKLGVSLQGRLSCTAALENTAPEALEKFVDSGGLITLKEWLDLWHDFHRKPVDQSSGASGQQAEVSEAILRCLRILPVTKQSVSESRILLCVITIMRDTSTPKGVAEQAAAVHRLWSSKAFRVQKPELPPPEPTRLEPEAEPAARSASSTAAAQAASPAAGLAVEPGKLPPPQGVWRSGPGDAGAVQRRASESRGELQRFAEARALDAAGDPRGEDVRWLSYAETVEDSPMPAAAEPGRVDSDAIPEILDELLHLGDVLASLHANNSKFQQLQALYQRQHAAEHQPPQPLAVHSPRAPQGDDDDDVILITGESMPP
eukprot:TRINITY_DN20502_c0_g1_i1.p1 TRINITY_DN20502_c0_g1~~TRINITY_DN20502_c0_g1_i1.p1  ORF type:complete len:517 (+),score=114.44 TRINITY_DN20502_c0_g1_i1:62-1612(+)